MGIRILIADDHGTVREGLKSVFGGTPGMQVIGEASNGREAVAQAERLIPDIVIMDISMPVMNGLEASREIVEKEIPTRIIAFSMYLDKQYISQMFGVGARGYLLKDSGCGDITAAVRAVSEGKIYVSPRVATALGKG